MHSPLIVWRRSLAVLFGLSLVLSASPSSADVWDNDPTNEDDSNQTDNELFHGAIQVHDLAAQGGVVDQDWFVIRSRAFSSYEVLVDGLQGEIWASAATPLPVDRVDGTGAVLTAGTTPPGGLGSSRGVRWANNTGTTSLDFIRVDGSTSTCTTTCTTNAQYTIRMWETTGAISRFNNSGSQLTVLLLQNPTDYVISGTAYLWDTSGTLTATQAFTLLAKGLLISNLSTIAPGASGSITVTQNGRFGDLQGKSVALEPSTGFSFDTPLAYRAH
jgi:hypothetical protein